MKHSKLTTFFTTIFLFLIASSVVAQQPTLVGYNPTGSGGGNSFSISYRHEAVSQDGRYVVFTSLASDFAPSDLNNQFDVFVRDTVTGVTTLVSADYTGSSTANLGSGNPAISRDGRFVVFYSSASNLVRNDTNGKEDVFVRDMLTGRTRLIKVHTILTAGFNPTGDPKFSGDGRYLVFWSQVGQIFAYDLLTSEVKNLSLDRNGQETWDARNPYVSGNGRYVVFESTQRLTLQDNNNIKDIYVRDLVADVSNCLSVDPTGMASGNAESLISPFGSPISDDGRRIVFISTATNLVPGVVNGFSNLFIRDLATGTTTIANLNSAGVPTGSVFNGSISADGNTVALITRQALTADDDNTDVDVYVRTLTVGETRLVTPNFPRDPNLLNHILYWSISGDGRFVAFAARNTAAPYELFDLYVRDLRVNRTVLVSRNFQGTGGGDGTSGNANFSADGRFLCFTSHAKNLVPKSVFQNVYLFGLELDGLGSVDRNDLSGKLN